MTDNTDLFNPEEDPSNLFTPDNEVDPDKDYFSELVGEGKKYRDEKALAKSRVVADRHISQIERENAELRQELQKRLSLEEFYEKVKTHTPPSPSNPPEPTDDDRERNEISLEQIGSLVDQRMQQQTVAERQKQNLTYVMTEAQNRLGTGFQKILRDRAAELGESESDLTQMAMHKPKVFLKLMLPDEKDTHIPTAPRSEVNAAGTNTLDGKVRNQSWYNQLKKTDPTKYTSTKVQAQMHKDALALGEKFFQ